MGKDNTIKINPNDIRIRDERIKDMITSTGGVARVFVDKKKKGKSDRVGRKNKHKKSLDND
jgi:hypothetical protein